MDTQKYVIVDIHPDDAFYDWKDKIVGHVGDIGFMHFTEGHDGYLGGTFHFSTPITIVDDDGNTGVYDSLYFYAIQLQTLEDNTKENGNVVHGLDDDRRENSPS